MLYIPPKVPRSVGVFFPGGCNVLFLPLWGLHASLGVHFPTCDHALQVNYSSVVPEN